MLEPTRPGAAPPAGMLERKRSAPSKLLKPDAAAAGSAPPVTPTHVPRTLPTAANPDLAPDPAPAPGSSALARPPLSARPLPGPRSSSTSASFSATRGAFSSRVRSSDSSALAAASPLP
eukprot:224114-Chlamydomonas_euryale.AAC.2